MGKGFSPPYTIFFIFYYATNNLFIYFWHLPPSLCSSMKLSLHSCSLFAILFWKQYLHQSHFIQSNPILLSIIHISTRFHQLQILISSLINHCLLCHGDIILVNDKHLRFFLAVCFYHPCRDLVQSLEK